MKPTAPPLSMLLTGVIVAAIMIVAADVLIPLALATLLSFVLAIPVRALQRLRLPRPLAVVVVVLAAFGAIFAFGQILAQEVSDLTDRLPQYEAAIGQKIDALEGLAAKRSVTLEPARRFLKTLDREFEAARRGSSEPDVMTMPTARGLVPRRASDMLGLPVDWLVAIVSPLVEPLASASLSFIFVVFILIQREDLRNRFIRLAGVADIPHTTMALDDAARRLSRLFLAQLVINATYGALIGLGLSLIGVPSAFVWGVLTGALRFVPFVGPVLGLIFPLTLAIAVGSGWSMAFWTVALYAGLESVTGEVVEPLFEGRTAGLTPVAIVVAAIFWWWIWGPIGLVMATPLTVVLVALGRHFEALKPLDILLGDRPALSDAEAFYQSMVAGNLMEAIAQAKAFMATRTLSDYCDAVVRPALMLAHEDFRRGALEGETLRAFETTFARLFEEMPRKRRGRENETRSSFAPSLISTGAHGALDDAASVVIAALARVNGLRVVTAPRIEAVDRSEASFVCLSCLDSADRPAIAESVRGVRTNWPRAKLVLGLWGVADDQAVDSLRSAVNADAAFHSFREAEIAMLEEKLEKRSGADASLPDAPRTL